jgi:hypothetical protein
MVPDGPVSDNGSVEILQRRLSEVPRDAQLYKPIIPR